MPSLDNLRRYTDDLAAIRRDLHANPELGFEETRTARIVAEHLASYGIDEVHTGIARTGVVGVVRGRGGSNRAIGLRADMDALPITEKNDFAHRSRVDGRMHACGHDGHTTMLLGAARWLAENRDAYDGTVYLIFQPAEEGRAGGRAMVEEGLFERFPCEQVFGLHNMPGIPVGEVSMCDGPCMAAADEFRITVLGKGSHAAMPHVARDPVLAAAHIVSALQSVVARRIDPVQGGVLSVTQFHGGEAFNVIPEEVVLRGTARSFLPEVRDLLEEELRRIAANVAAAFDARAEVAFHRNYPSTINTSEETALAASAARSLLGEARVDTDGAPKMGAEDFSYMLNERPGCYIWLGNGVPGERGGDMVHTPRYDFNDDAIPYGVGYWAALVEGALPVSR